MAEAVTVKVLSRSGRDMGSFPLQRNQPFDRFKQQFYEKHRKYTPDRQWFTLDTPDKAPVKDSAALVSTLQIKNGDTLTFKDLGLQIAWRTVFMVEYFGPILVHALFYFLPQLFYSEAVTRRHYVQKIAFALVVFHYLKREFETVFVHHFSNATMPIFNIFKNSFHYWVLGGLSIAYFLYHPHYTPPIKSDAIVSLCAVLFVLAELGNLHAHVVLKNLRPPGTKVKGIPRGGLFEFVTCANYTYEILAWVIFALFTQTLTAYVFLVVSTAQIAQWALKKHIAMKKEFGDKVPRRKILFPFIW